MKFCSGEMRFQLKPWPQSILTPCVKNFTAAPVPFRKSGQTFNVCDHHYFQSYYGLNTGVQYLIVKLPEEVYVSQTKRVGE